MGGSTCDGVQVNHLHCAFAVPIFFRLQTYYQTADRMHPHNKNAPFDFIQASSACMIAVYLPECC